MNTEKKIKSYTGRTKSGKEFEKSNTTKTSFLEEISALPKTFRHMGEQYVPTGKVEMHTEQLGGATYKVATCTAKSKKGNSITLYQYNKKGRKDFGLPKKWDIDVTR